MKMSSKERRRSPIFCTASATVVVTFDLLPLDYQQRMADHIDFSLYGVIKQFEAEVAQELFCELKRREHARMSEIKGSLTLVLVAFPVGPI